MPCREEIGNAVPVPLVEIEGHCNLRQLRHVGYCPTYRGQAPSQAEVDWVLRSAASRSPRKPRAMQTLANTSYCHRPSATLRKLATMVFAEPGKRQHRADAPSQR